MNYDLEDELTRAFRRKNPSRDLTPRRQTSVWRAGAAAALAVALASPAALIQYRLHQQRRAKDQLVFAFHLTARKLEMAQQKLRTVK